MTRVVRKRRMTSVVANKIGLDLVDIQIQVTGTAETDMFFQQPVLDQRRDYVVGISELSIPLTAESILSTNAVNLTSNFIELRRRRAAGLGAYLNPGNVANTVIAGDYAHFRLQYKNIVTSVDFVRLLAEYFQTISNHADVNLVVRLVVSPSGVIQIQAAPFFWDRFYFVLSPYAEQILGAFEPYIIFTWNAAAGVIKSSKFADAIYTATNAPQPANVGHFMPSPDTVQVTGVSLKYSVYRYLDHRLRVELDADLAIPANILVENGNQKMHYNIASFAIPQKYEGRLSIKDNVVSDSISHVSHIYVGNTILKGKETPTTDWYKLVSAANIQNMRLHVFIVRRDYNPQYNKWSLTRNKLTLQSDMTWFATMKFIQQF